MSDNVVPFRTRRQPTITPELPPEQQGLHRRTRAAAPGARELAAQQNGEQRVRYGTAVAKQRNDALIATGRVVPARITLALDLGGHEGPDVDIACGAVEPAVDLWECGIETPTGEQLRLLSELTDFPLAWFYMPIEPGPLLGSDNRIWICGTDGCEAREQDYVDERGVLHYGGEPPRTPPANYQPALFT